MKDDLPIYEPALDETSSWLSENSHEEQRRGRWAKPDLRFIEVWDAPSQMS